MRNDVVRVAALALTVALGSAALSAQDTERSAPSFDQFLAGVRRDALARGIRQDTLDRTLADLTPAELVVARDRAQPEQTQSLDAYLASRLSARTVARAEREAGRQHTLLNRVEAHYGVPRSLLVALWGLESDFGGFTGTYPTIRALATLAYDARRPMFREELLHALAIVDRGDVTPDRMKGSWAGAMGQPQFMPSSFLKYAVDFDGDGRADIWSAPPDVFASMANYLREKGWTTGERWGREVTVSRAAMTRVDRAVPMRATGCRAIRELTVARPIAEWTRLGVTLAGGRALAEGVPSASLVRGRQRHFLVYRNFEAILDYNCSNAYAVSVGLLADRIAAN